MATLASRATGVTGRRRTDSVAPAPVDGLGALLCHPASPAVAATTLLTCGYGLLVALGEQTVTPPASLVLVILISLAMVMLVSAPLRDIPKLPERAVTFLRTVSLLSLGAELVYFGAPILGSVPYNEFGWPGVHHLAVMHWMLVLFGTRRKNLDLAISLVIAVVLFNRQMALFSLLAYLMTTSIPAGRMFLGAVAVGALLLALGVLRNRALEVDVSTSGDTLDGPFAGALFFIYLYLTGPLHIGLALSSDFWDTQLSPFWNTVPEWAKLSATSGVVPPALSFALFYGLCAAIALVLRNARSWELRCLGTLIHVYSFFAFFSDVLISTPIIANYLVLAVVGMRYSARYRL